MTIRILAIAALTSTFATGALAANYHCTFKAPSGNGFVPREVVVEFAEDGSAARVTDPILLHVEQAPKDAKYSKDTNQRMIARWQAKDVPSAGGFSVTIDYSLNFNKANSRANVTMNLRGFDNTDSGNGTCKLI